MAAKNLAFGPLLYYPAFEVDVEKWLGENIFLLRTLLSVGAQLSFTSQLAELRFELKVYILGLKLGIYYRIGRE